MVYVSLYTLRTIFVLKRQTYMAAGISLLEMFVYIIGLSLVLQNLDDPWNIVAYCIGYALGIISGSFIEERLAMGYVTVQIIVRANNSSLPSLLRQAGYGVTSWTAEGKDNFRLVLEVLTKRKNEKKLTNYATKIHPDAFIVSYEPRGFRGGFWTKRVK